MATSITLIIAAALIVAALFAIQKQWKTAGLAAAVCVLFIIIYAALPRAPNGTATPIDQTPVNHFQGPGGCTGVAC